MKKSIKSGSDRSAIVKYGAVIIAVILWYSFLWSPLNARIQKHRTNLEAQEMKINRLKKRITRLKGIDKKLEAEKRRLQAFKSKLVPGKSLQMVSTNIQNSFLKDASDAGLEVLVYRSGPRRHWRKYQLAVSIFNTKGSLSQFVELLERIETGRQLLRLNNVTISNIRGKASKLNINLELEALFMGDKIEL